MTAGWAVRPIDLALVGALAALGAGLFAGPLSWLVFKWQRNDYYAHGPFVPATSAVLAWQALERLRRARAEGDGGPATAPAEGRPVALGLATAGLALRLAGAALGSELVGAVALVPTLLGAVGYLAGRAVARALAFPILFLLFAVPLPVMDDLGFYFQRSAAAGAAALLGTLGVPAAYQGAELSLPNASFIVGTPCSGLYSTVAMTGLGVLYARMLGLPSRVQLATFLGLLVPLAIGLNILRLGSLLGVAWVWGAAVAMAYYHNALDVVFWALALGLLFALGKGVRWAGSRAAP